MVKEGVSVIVCCYNSGLRLGETLRHLYLQQTPTNLPWEIILVDNGSTDNTKLKAFELWKSFGHPAVSLKIVDQPIQGLSFARAKGIEESVYNTLIFCDDDNWFQTNYISDAYSILKENSEIGALGGTGIPVSDTALPDWFNKYRFSFACYPQGKEDGELSEATASLYGAGLVLRREALVKLSLKKFSPILTDRIAGKLMSGGDTELSYAIRLIGYKLWFSEKLKFFHFLPADRLSAEYLFKLNKSLSICSSNLIIYRYVLSGKGVSRIVWMKDAAYQLYLFSNSWIKFTMPGGSSFDKRLSFDFSFHSLKGIVKQFGKYRLRYRQILNLRMIKEV